MGPGVYVHVPFCKRRCGYCDFYVEVRGGALRARTIDAILLEASRRSPSWRGVAFDNVFLGGGTPSHLGPGLLVKLCEGLRSALDLRSVREWTMEANPESATPELLEAALAAGIDRLSLGAQSFDPGELSRLNRLHGADDIRAAVDRARCAGFANVNLDLIYGLPGSEDGARWERSLREAVALSPDHVSAYLLSLEAHVPMGREVTAGGLVLPADTEARNQYDQARRMLSRAGYEQYEISNWARPGKPCRHNVNVWTGGTYLGLGPGAHGFDGRTRRANRADLATYCESLESGADAPHVAEDVDPRGRKEEMLFLGLRLREGIAWKAVRDRLDPAEFERFAERVRALTAEGLLADDGTRVRIHEEGIFVSNALLAHLIEAL